MTTEQTYPAQVDGDEVAEMLASEVRDLPWDTERANNRRALRALDAVVTYGEVDEMRLESLRTVLGDLLNDLRHLGDAAGIDVEELLVNTGRCYGEELYDQFQ